MFENLTEKLQRAFKNLRGQGTLTEENIQEALREIRVAMLDADVNLSVVNELIDHIRVKAIGSEVLTALSPSEQVIKIVRDELVDLLGRDTARFKFASQPPTVILMAGLQGSGKTTTSGKLAAWLKKGGHRPMLVSVDVYRPAAREQLKIVAKAIEARLYEGKINDETPGSKLVERLASEARREARILACDTLIVDTAGRLHVDEELMTGQEISAMTVRRHPGRLSVVLVLGLVVGLAEAEGPEFRVGMKILARSPGLVLKDGNRSVTAPANPRVYVVERVEGDKVRLFHWQQKGLAPAAEVIPLDHAVSYFDGRIKATPRDTFGYLARAMARVQGRASTGALIDCDEAIRLEPKDARAYWLRRCLADEARGRQGPGRPQRSSPPGSHGPAGSGRSKSSPPEPNEA